MNSVLAAWTFAGWVPRQLDPVWIPAQWDGTDWTSEPVEVPPATELLVSWAPRPGSTGQFAIQLAACFADGWSDWATLAHWPNSKEPASSDRRVSIDVDVASFSEPAHALRLRCRSCSDGPSPPLDALVAACDVPSERRHTSSPPARGPFFQDVPYRSQFSEREELAPRICGPTSLAMQLAGRGVFVDTEDVARAAYDEAHDIYGNWSRLAAVAAAHGTLSWVRRFPSLGDLERHIMYGFGAIVSLAYEERELDGAPLERTNGHLLVYRGWTAEGDPLCNDPAFRDQRGSGVVYDRGQFETAWTRHGGTAILLRGG